MSSFSDVSCGKLHIALKAASPVLDLPVRCKLSRDLRGLSRARLCSFEQLSACRLIADKAGNLASVADISASCASIRC